MRAAVIEGARRPDRRFADVPVPAVGPGEALLRVGACAVDRFDLAIRKGVAGNEPDLCRTSSVTRSRGTVAALGSGVDELAVGDRVGVDVVSRVWQVPVLPSGTGDDLSRVRWSHRGAAVPGGGTRRYVVLPARNLVPIPSGVEFPAASILANAIGTPYHALYERMRGAARAIASS